MHLNTYKSHIKLIDEVVEGTGDDGRTTTRRSLQLLTVACRLLCE